MLSCVPPGGFLTSLSPHSHRKRPTVGIIFCDHLVPFSAIRCGFRGAPFSAFWSVARHDAAPAARRNNGGSGGLDCRALAGASGRCTTRIYSSTRENIRWVLRLVLPPVACHAHFWCHTRAHERLLLQCAGSHPARAGSGGRVYRSARTGLYPHAA